MTPLVSIIVPTYNVERYVEECMDSLINQTYENTEIIVLDDASTDATLYLLKKYGYQIKLIENEVNKGQGTRRNEGIKLAKGEYIYFVDADDWIKLDAIEKLVTQAARTDVDLVRFNGTVFFEGSVPPTKQANYNFAGVLEAGKIYSGVEILKNNRKSYSASPCLYLIKKEVIVNNNLKFLEGVLHEDEYFTTCLFGSINTMLFINETFYHRRYRISSTMTEQNKKHKLRSFNSYFSVFQALEEEYNKSNRTHEEKRFIKRQLLSIYNNLIESTVPYENKKKVQKIKSITGKDKMLLQLIKVKNKILSL